MREAAPAGAVTCPAPRPVRPTDPLALPAGPLHPMPHRSMCTCSTARCRPPSARCAACWRTTRRQTACGEPGGARGSEGIASIKPAACRGAGLEVLPLLMLGTPLTLTLNRYPLPPSFSIHHCQGARGAAPLHAGHRLHPLPQAGGQPGQLPCVCVCASSTCMLVCPLQQGTAKELGLLAHRWEMGCVRHRTPPKAQRWPPPSPPLPHSPLLVPPSPHSLMPRASWWTARSRRPPP